MSLFLHHPAGLNVPREYDSLNKRGEGRWDKNDNKDKGTTAAHSPYLHRSLNHTLFWHSCFIIPLSLLAVHHSFIAHFKSFDMKSRCGGGIQGEFGWLNVYVCKTERQRAPWFDKLRPVGQCIPSGFHMLGVLSRVGWVLTRLWPCARLWHIIYLYQYQLSFWFWPSSSLPFFYLQLKFLWIYSVILCATSCF